MPYRNYADFVRWNRDYQRRRSAAERAARASLEGKIIALAREQPEQHDVLSLYHLLQPEGVPIKAVLRAVGDLCQGQLLLWSWKKRRLILREGEDNPFLARPCPGVESFGESGSSRV